VVNPSQPQTSPASYVGEDTCLGCHEEQRKGYFESPHHRATDPRTPAAKQGCESCHGPGSLHVDDPSANPLVRFTGAAPRTENAACVACHNRGDHAVWEGSQHERRDLTCATCHGVHEYRSEVSQLKKLTELETCASCHRDKIAKLDRSGHMPVREGKMQCSTCHNPHGATNVRLLRKGDSLAEMCTSCHADKRGPYLWEHAPTRDGCATCHDPHGSSNERMLVAKPPILCQRCHIATRHPSTIYDAGLIGSGSSPSVRIYARSCVTCHSAIHGSNHPSGQRFVR
jgi:DmsE family decaheme c-type cytochrome